MEHYLIVAAAVVAYVLWTLSTADLGGPLRDVPGPFIARFTSLWETSLFFDKKKSFVKSAQELHERYGPIVRLGPNRYSIADPDMAKPIYNMSSKFTKGKFYHAFLHTNTHDDIFVTRDNAHHSATRRTMAQLYSTSALKSYEPLVDDVTGELVQTFDRMAREKAVIPLNRWLQFYALDVIGQITFSTTFDLVKTGVDKEGVIEALGMAGYLPGILGTGFISCVDLARRACQLMPWTGIGRLLAWTGRHVIGAQREVQKGSSSSRSDFNEKALDLIAQGKMQDFHRYHVIGQNLNAGSDTTGIALSAFVWHMSQSPESTKKLREEIIHCKNEGRLSSPATFAETQAMPYLQACIKEALRCHPGVGVILARDVPQGGAQIGDYYFPEGAVVGSNAWSTNYHKSTWGNDADVFRPERWLEDEQKAKKFESAMMSFGAGARTCIGKNISLLEMSKLLPEIYRRYEFEVVSEECKLECGWFVYPKYDVRIKALASYF